LAVKLEWLPTKTIFCGVVPRPLAIAVPSTVTWELGIVPVADAVEDAVDDPEDDAEDEGLV
jgi:hypothetical protein